MGWIILSLLTAYAFFSWIRTTYWTAKYGKNILKPNFREAIREISNRHLDGFSLDEYNNVTYISYIISYYLFVLIFFILVPFIVFYF